MSQNDKNLSSIHSGYIGNSEKWNQYFECISSAYQISYKNNVNFTQELYQQKILAKEAELKIKLPKSYKDFLMADGVNFVNNLMANNKLTSNNEQVFFDVNIVDRFKKEIPTIYLGYTDNERYMSDPDIADSNYYVYENYNGIELPYPIRLKYSRLNFLTIGNFGSEVYGLSDIELTADNEMETWYFSPDIGAIRYRSFAEFIMTYIHDTFTVDQTTIAESKCSNILLDMNLLKSQFLDRK